MSLAVSVALLLLACSAGDTGTPGDDSGAGDGGAGDGGTGDGGVGAGEVSVEGVEVQVSPFVPTVATLTFQTDVPTTGKVWFGGGGILSLSRDLEATPSTRHEVVLVGVPELAAVGFRIEVEDETGNTGLYDGGSYQTGSFDTAMPRGRVVTLDVDRGAGGFTLMPVQLETQRRQWLAIFDDQGRVVWAYEADETSHRMRLSPDGGGVVYFDNGPDAPGFLLRSLSWAGALRWELEVEGADQDFDVLGDDSFAILFREVELLEFSDGPAEVFNDGILEVSVDGSVRTIWQALDHLPLDTSAPAPTNYVYEGIIDWTHVNFLQYEVEEDALCMTMRHLPAVSCVARSDGEPLWLLGDRLGDFQGPPGGRILLAPHSVQLVEGGIVIFDQAASGPDGCSRAMRIDLDVDLGTASESWRYESEDCLSTNYLGNAQLLEGGNMLVDFGQEGRVDEVTASGDVVMRLETDLSNYFLYAERVMQLGATRQ